MVVVILNCCNVDFWFIIVLLVEGFWLCVGLLRRFSGWYLCGFWFVDIIDEFCWGMIYVDLVIWKLIVFLVCNIFVDLFCVFNLVGWFLFVWLCLVWKCVVIFFLIVDLFGSFGMMNFDLNIFIVNSGVYVLGVNDNISILVGGLGDIGGFVFDLDVFFNIVVYFNVFGGEVFVGMVGIFIGSVFNVGN